MASSRIELMTRHPFGPRYCAGRVPKTAGLGEFSPLGSITEEYFDKLFNINVKGALLTVQNGVKDKSYFESKPAAGLFIDAERTKVESNVVPITGFTL